SAECFPTTAFSKRSRPTPQSVIGRLIRLMPHENIALAEKSKETLHLLKRQGGNSRVLKVTYPGPRHSEKPEAALCQFAHLLAGQNLVTSHFEEHCEEV